MTTSTSWADLARPVLRPGFRVVRRDDRHLQLGLDPPERLVLPDQPGLLEALTEPARTPPRHLHDVLDELVRAGWVVDAGARARSSAGRAPFAATVDAGLDALLARTCTAAGIAREATGVARLVATVGEPRRSVSDALMRDDTPHLWLAVLPTSVRIGPYVEPGRTACLRCVDAHLGDVDPRRATVLHQLEELASAPVTDADPCLTQLGVSFAVRDLVRLLDGEPSAVRSATVSVTGELQVTRRDWLRHAHCGCAWG